MSKISFMSTESKELASIDMTGSRWTMDEAGMLRNFDTIVVPVKANGAASFCMLTGNNVLRSHGKFTSSASVVRAGDQLMIIPGRLILEFKPDEKNGQTLCQASAQAQAK